MADIVTDQVIEKHARANYHAVRSRSPIRDSLPYWEGQSPVLQAMYRDSATYALAAVLEDIIRAVQRESLPADAGKEPTA